MRASIVPGSMPSLAVQQVVGSEQEQSRLLLCEATAVIMRQCFSLLGIKPLYRI